MTIESIKAIAKDRYGKDLTDEQAMEHLVALETRKSTEELENADMELDGACGTPSDDKDPPSNISGTVRYFKLRNGEIGKESGFVARIQIKWEKYENKNVGGNIMRIKTNSGMWEESDYHDICAYRDRTVDLNNSGIPEGADVWLKAFVCGGYDRIAKERFTYSSSSSNTAKYFVHGTICYNYLKKE